MRDSSFDRMWLRDVLAPVLAIACVSTGCALDFRRFRADASADGAVRDARADTPSVVDADVPMIDRFVPPDLTLPDVVDVTDAFDALEDDTPAPIDVPAEPEAACGGLGDPCCSAGAGGCTAGATCSAGTCVACGGLMQPCCDGVCSGSRVCVGTMCHALCGAVGQSCCAGECENGTAACISNRCEACGGPVQRCCPTGCGQGFACNMPLSSWMSGYCFGCGHYGESCCTSPTACVEGNCQTAGPSGSSVCLGNTAGNRGGTCPTPSTSCSDGSFCTNDHYCSACGGQVQFCCNGVCRSPYTCDTGFNLCGGG